MAGRRKKKSSSAKKNKALANRGSGAPSVEKPPPGAAKLEDVLSRADSAMELSDVSTALRLFDIAARALRDRLHDGDGGGGEAGDDVNGAVSLNGAEDRKTLATVLGKTGEMKASNGDVEGARCDFLDAVELLGTDDGDAPMEGGGGVTSVDEILRTAQGCEARAELHLYLGQLSSGSEALESFCVGVSELLRATSALDAICKEGADKFVGMDDDDDRGDLQQFLLETRKQLCAAHCSIAELYLTDLCDEPDAESSCESALKAALTLDEKIRDRLDGGGLPDALQTMANLRLSQSRVSEALRFLLDAYERMKLGCEAMSSLVGLGRESSEMDDGREAGAQELVEVDAASSLPGYEFRCQTAKLMLECAALVDEGNADGGGESSGQESDSPIADKRNLCAEASIQVLGSLLAENDEVIEVWYLLGCAFMACSPPNPESARYYWEKALDMLMKIKVSAASFDGEDDEQQRDEIDEQISEVKSKLTEVGDAVESDDMDTWPI